MEATMTFQNWLSQVDGIVGETIDNSIHDLDLIDCPLRQWYDEGMTVIMAAAWVCEAA